MAFLDLTERYRLRKASQKRHIEDPAFAIVGIGTRFRGNTGQTHDGSFTLAMVDQYIIVGVHCLNGTYRLWITDAIPDGYVITLQIVDGVALGVSFCEKVCHRRILPTYRRLLPYIGCSHNYRRRGYSQSIAYSEVNWKASSLAR